MEPLRIRIPQVFVCSYGTCSTYVRAENAICARCFVSNARMRQKVAAAALPSKPEVIHSTALRRNLSG